MSSNSKAVQVIGQKGFINRDAESRMIIGYTKNKGLFGRIKYLIGRIITAVESDLWSILIGSILLIIAFVIAVLFRAKIAALILE